MNEPAFGPVPARISGIPAWDGRRDRAASLSRPWCNLYRSFVRPGQAPQHDRKSDAAPSDPGLISPAKIAPRLPKADLVIRARLLQKLDQALGVKLVLVVAPAGFGKSTLLSQWCQTLRSRDLPCAWLSLDAADADPNLFLAHVAIALAHAGVAIGELEIGARNGFSDSATNLVKNRLVRQLSSTSTRKVLVLDDYHLVASPAVDEVIMAWLRDAPDTFTLIINSRTPPSLDTATLVASGEAVEIDADLLRLTRTETFAVLGDLIRSDDGEEIFRLTEGWPVAVQLARIQKQTRPELPLRYASPGGLIAKYLTDQILSSLREEQRDFLLDVASLDRFNPDLANAVRERNDSGQLLAQLDSLSALLVHLDYEGDWYRLHHLFGECLRDAFRRRAPQRMRRIYSAASTWYAERSQTVEAVLYATRAENWQDCERLVLQAGGWKIILKEGIGALRSLLRFIPKSVIEQSPRMLIAKAYLCCKDGEYGEARALLAAASNLRVADDRAAERDEIAVGSIVQVYADSDEWVRADTPLARRVRRDDLDPFEAGALDCEEVLYYFARGDFDRAEKALKSEFSFLRRSGSVLALNYCYLQAGIAALHRGRFDVAAANITRALEMAKGNFGADSGLKNLALVLDFALRVWRGEASSAHFDDFSETLSYIEEHDGWTNIYMLGLDAAFHLAEQCGRFDATDNLAKRYAQLAERRNLDRLRDFVRVFAARAARHAGRKAEATLQFGVLRGWMLKNLPADRPWVWQAYFVGAASTDAGRTGPSLTAKRHLMAAIEHSKGMAVDLHTVRLLVAWSTYQRECGAPEDAKRTLLNAVRLASRRAILGPFLCDAGTTQTLKQLRRDLRTNENELLSTAFMSQVLDRTAALRPDDMQPLLSDREQEVLDQLALQKTNREIARHLELTENTVKFHLKNLFSKLGVNRRAQAAAEARRLGLIE